MSRSDSVGCGAGPAFAASMLTVGSLGTVRSGSFGSARGGNGPPRAPPVVLLLHQLGLGRGGHLRGEVDVAGQLGLALHRVRLAGRRVLEHEGREVRARRLLAPVASAIAQSIARRAWSFCVETVK